MVSATTITVTAPAHAAGTVDITVTTNGQTATIHGYTYLNTGNIAPQPAPHPLPGSGGSGGSVPMAQPVRHDDPGTGGGQPHVADTPTATPHGAACTALREDSTAKTPRTPRRKFFHFSWRLGVWRLGGEDFPSRRGYFAFRAASTLAGVKGRSRMRTPTAS